jgi:hypothetical protein
LVALAVVGIGLAAVWAVQWSPPFYRHALVQTIEPALAAEARDELSRCLLDVYNCRWEEERFATCLRQETLNAFLASEDLHRTGPAWWPSAVRHVRLAIAPDRVRIGMQYRLGPLTTVVWAEGEMYLTPHDNELALRVHRARLGAIPLPPSTVLREIGRSSQQAGLIVQWSEAAQDPVMLVRPTKSPGTEDQPHIVLEQLALQEGAVLLAGRWVRTTSSPWGVGPSAAGHQASEASNHGSQPSASVEGSAEVSSAHATPQTR